MKKKFWILRALKISVMITLFINLVGYGVMALWNWLIPVLFKLPAITFLQALGLLVLTRLLFGGWWRGKGFRRNYYGRMQMQERFAAMTPEEKEQFRVKMQDRCGRSGFEQTDTVKE